ncbi:cellulose-binding protein [Amycolatopsis acidicola]|uniref:Cellulose-binding protein n=1 Tax=Amycolatopsis acidicola TaxID=2596893 RepID=A0A5N0UY85_9PSEU|nr:cellulose-binding protein [Amycolatopsis acidicola]KAA9157739.1 cellulose-binding protein [Amycolatopsis acidicola]
MYSEATRVDTEELVPLHTDFDVRWRGYDQEQVRYWISQFEADLAVVTADRDAALSQRDDLAAELERTRAALSRLQARFDRVCRTPPSVDGLTDRLRRMVELAQDEAGEITARARTAAENQWAAAQEAAGQLRARHLTLLRELDHRRAELEREHRDLLARTRADVEALTTQAHAERAALDTQAARRRAAIERDFQRDLQSRRAAAERDIAELRATARAEADAMLSEARQAVQQLHHIRDDVLAQLRDAQALVAEALPLLAEDTDNAAEAPTLTGVPAPVSALPAPPDPDAGTATAA